MLGNLIVTFTAGVKLLAAGHFNGNDVQLAGIMCTASLCIYAGSVYDGLLHHSIIPRHSALLGALGPLTLMLIECR